ncbi:MAG: acetolactate synthase large subunit [Chlorobi bacterium]|nr:acetolactate synthase large subunit [Chlorobiota bacterium]
MKSSDLFVKALENEGVKYIFGIPGEENLDFLNSLKDSNIKLILTRHEQGAGFMAATYGRLTGEPGVCLSTLGPGATNLVTPAAYAQLGAMPMVMITGQKPIKKSKQGKFQIVDIVDMMRPLTKFTHQIVNGNNIPSVIREAFRIAEEERPGAVHIELPEDIAAEQVNYRLMKVHSMQGPIADIKVIEKASEMIKNSKMPLLLIGAGANRKKTSEALTEFINKTGIPFFNTQMGKGVVDEKHPLFLGTAALSSKDFVHCAIEHADLIINVGHDTIEKPPFFMEEEGTKVIHINFFPAVIDVVYFPQLEVVGDISSSVERLTLQLNHEPHWDFSYYNKIKQEVDTHLSKYFEDLRFPVLPQRIVKVIRDVMPADGIVTLDNGIYKIWFARNYKCYKPNTLLLDNALATMGAGLPSAIAAKIIYPHRKVISVNGDGGFMMNSQELETAVRLNIDLTVIILNDSAYGMIKWKQQDMEFESYGLDYSNPDFVKYAESFGAHGHRINKTEELPMLLEECFYRGGVHLIDIPVDYSLNNTILNKKIQQKLANFN